VRGQLGLSGGGVTQGRFSSSAHSILTMRGADGVSFVESLPRQFVVGKTGLVLVAVQGAPPLKLFAIFGFIKSRAKHNNDSGYNSNLSLSQD